MEAPIFNCHFVNINHVTFIFLSILNFCPNEYSFICHFAIISLSNITRVENGIIYKNELNQQVNTKNDMGIGSPRVLAQRLLFFGAEDKEREHR